MRALSESFPYDIAQPIKKELKTKAGRNLQKYRKPRMKMKVFVSPGSKTGMFPMNLEIARQMPRARTA